MKPLQRKALESPWVVELPATGDVVDKAFRRLIDRMDREEVVQFEPLLDEGIPVVRE